MTATLIVDGVKLQGVIALDTLFEVCKGLFVAFDRRIVFRQRSLRLVEAILIDPVYDRLRVDLQLAGIRPCGVRFRVLDEGFQLRVSQVVVHRTFHLVDASLLEFLVRNASGLWLTLYTHLGNISSCDRQKRFLARSIWLHHRCTRQPVEGLLRQRDRVDL